MAQPKQVQSYAAVTQGSARSSSQPPDPGPPPKGSIKNPDDIKEGKLVLFKKWCLQPTGEESTRRMVIIVQSLQKGDHIDFLLVPVTKHPPEPGSRHSLPIYNEPPETDGPFVLYKEAPFPFQSFLKLNNVVCLGYNTQGDKIKNSHF